MRERNIFYGLFIVAVILVLGFMVIGSKGLGVSAPVNSTNYSGTIVINATTDNTTGHDNNATNATFFFFNLTSGDLVYNVTIGPQDANGNSTFNSTIVTSTFLPDGTYNLTVNLTNNSSLGNATWSNSSVQLIQIDNTAPRITINSPVNNTYIGNLSAAFVFNATVLETGVGLDVVNFSNNASGDLGAETNLSNDYNLTVTRGENTLRVIANDTLHNNNNSTITVWWDQGLPSVGLVSPLNATWTDDQYTFNFTDDFSPNASCELIIDDVGYGFNSTTLNYTNTVLRPNTTITSGTHNWTVNCTDLASNVGFPTTIDAYDVVVVNASAPTNASYTSSTSPGNVSFEFNYVSPLINSTSTSNVTCELFVTNSSGSYLAMGDNQTALNNTVMTFTNNQSLLSDLNPNGASANWTVNCTYNNSVVGVSNGFYTLFVDNETPTIPALSSSTITSSSITVAISTSADVTSCDDTAPDAGTSISEVSAGNWELSESNLDSSTTKAFQVTCSDAAGNSATSVASSFTTTSTGGAGGTSSSGVTGKSSKTTWSTLGPSDSPKVVVSNGAIGVTQVEFEVNELVYGAWLNVIKVENFPSNVKSFDDLIYRRLSLSRSSVLKESIIKNAKIDFKVEKSWLTSNNLLKENIDLFRQVGDSWNPLNSAVTKDDKNYVYYTANSPGFSYFIIGEKETVAVPETTAGSTEDTVSDETAASMEAKEAEAQKEAMAQGSPVWPWVVFVLIVILALVWWWVKRR